MRRSFRPSTALLPITLLTATLFVAACGDSPVPLAPETPADIAFDAVAARAAQPGPDDWIVVFKPGVADPPGLARRLIDEHGGTLRFTYRYALKGFAATLPAQALNGIRNNQNVEYVEADGVVTVDGSGTDDPPESWGLDRIDERALGLDNLYRWDFDGTGVHAYVIDTGIWPTHEDFKYADQSGSRATAEPTADFIDDGRDGVDNCHGHGTHVAGTIGGLKYGLAKNVQLHGVRVLSCAGSGSYSQVIAGVNWVIQNRIDPAVANMSLGGGYSLSLNTAVNNAVASGVVFVVSAGNSNANACNQSPASAAVALTIGSTKISDSRSSFSNYGSCVDLFAPGSSIKSAYNTSNTATATFSGTSMSSPHVAGAAALYLDEDPSATTADVASKIGDNATAGVISNSGSGSPNLLLCSLFENCKEENPVTGTPVQAVDVSSVRYSGNKHKKGIADVTVVEYGTTNPASGILVTAEWFKNGGTTVVWTSAGTTTDGMVTLSSETIKGASTLQLCVKSLTGGGDDTTVNPMCSPPDEGGESGGELPPDPLPDLTAKLVTNRGGKTKVSLSWTAWSAAPTVDVLRNGSVIATISNVGSHTDNKNSSGEYNVCATGSTDPAACTGLATAR